jgi:hypothetical protein
MPSASWHAARFVLGSALDWLDPESCAIALLGIEINENKAIAPKAANDLVQIVTSVAE